MFEPPRRADRARNDEAIAAAAVRLLARNPATSMQAIADEAGVARYTVYRRRPTRKELLAGVRAATIRKVMEAIDAFPGWDDGIEPFQTLITDLLRVGRTYPMTLSGHRPAAEPGVVDARMIDLLARGQSAEILRADATPAFLNAAVLRLLSAASDLTPGGLDVPADVVVDMVIRAVKAGPLQRPGSTRTSGSGSRSR